jgi:hypothetical protein
LISPYSRLLLALHLGAERGSIFFLIFLVIVSVKLTPFDVIQDFLRTREVGEFLSGALAGAMTKAILAPLETIRLALVISYFMN